MMAGYHQDRAREYRLNMLDQIQGEGERAKLFGDTERLEELRQEYRDLRNVCRKFGDFEWEAAQA